MSQVVIGDILPRTQAVASGGQTIYDTNWTANYPSDVIVYSRAENTDADDLTQQLSYPSQYTVSFIGALQQVRVTLVTPSTLGDIVTIIRQTPADRENLYNNTNFTPSMLNNDFGILTLVDQQAQLVDDLVGPRYNYSAIINPLMMNEDTILPILPVNCTWVKNSTNTAIIPFLLPSGGIAPADATFILQTPDASLPNAQSLSILGDGLLYNTTTTGVLTIINQAGGAPGDVLTFTSPTTPPIWQAGAGGGGITNWQTVTAASITAAGGDGIVANRSATPVQVELPAIFNVGDEIAILGLGTGGWTMVANAGQTIKFGSISTSVAGSISSDIQNANIFIRGLVANTTWTVTVVNSNPQIL